MVKLDSLNNDKVFRSNCTLINTHPEVTVKGFRLLSEFYST